MSGLDTDTLRTMAEILLPRLEVNYRQSCQNNYGGMRPVVDAFLRARAYFPTEDYILEGDAIDLGLIKSLRGEIPLRCIVLGYPTITVEEKRCQILPDITHWSNNMTTEDVRMKIEEFIQFSKFLEKEAQLNDFDFVDTSSMNLNEVKQKTISSLMRQE